MKAPPPLLHNPRQPSIPEYVQLHTLIERQSLRSLRGLGSLSPGLLGLAALSPGLLLLPEWRQLGLTPEEHEWAELYLSLVGEFQVSLSFLDRVISRDPDSGPARFLRGEIPDIHPGTPLNHWAMLGAGLRIARAELNGQNLPGAPLVPHHDPARPSSNLGVSLPAGARQRFMEFGADGAEADALLILNDPTHAPEFLTAPPQSLRHWRAQHLARQLLDHVGLDRLGLLTPWPAPARTDAQPPLRLHWGDFSRQFELTRTEGQWRRTRPLLHVLYRPLTPLPIPPLGAADRQGEGLSEPGILLTALFLSPERLAGVLNTSPEAHRLLTELLLQLGRPPANWFGRVSRLRDLLRSHAA